jgi:hypothetical protein
VTRARTVFVSFIFCLLSLCGVYQCSDSFSFVIDLIFAEINSYAYSYFSFPFILIDFLCL